LRRGSVAYVDSSEDINVPITWSRDSGLSYCGKW
jgi:hypothetical protein